jgi:HK97 family phage prohead protease
MTMTDVSQRTRAGREERVFAVEGVEVREAEDGTRTFHGYASTFNQPYTVHDAYGTFTETMLPGAFSRSLSMRSDKIHLLVAHGGVPLASTKSGTLRLTEDKRGLRVEADLAPESPLAQTVISAVQRGDMDEMSIGFSVPDGGDNWNSDYSDRSVSETKLVEVSVLSRGANGGTEALIRAMNVNPEDVTSIRAGIARLEQLLEKEETPADTFDPEWSARMSRLWDRRIGGLPSLGYQSTDTPNLPTDNKAIVEPNMSAATALLLSLDGTIDSIELALAAGDIAQVTGLVAAADTTIDAVLEALGIPDPDELAELGDKGDTGE